MPRKKKDQKTEQMPLFANIPFSASIPNRASSRQENDFMVAIREGIQNFVKAGGDWVSEPITFEIDFKKMAKMKGVTRWESLQRSYARTLSKVKSMPLSQTVHYIDENGEEKEETYWMLSRFIQNFSNGTVKILVNPEFQNYYVAELLKHPDIQIDIRFHESCKSCYTYPFVNWLSAKVAEMQREGVEYPFHIYISYDELRRRVPTPLRNGKPTLSRPNDYKRNAIEKAIEDINSNPFSQLCIENTEIVSQIVNRKIAEFLFVVSFRNRTISNSVSLLVSPTQDDVILDDAGLPPWSYIKQKMLDLGYGASSIPQWEKRKAKAWRALLISWVKISKLHHENPNEPINRGGYLQTLLKSRLPNTPFRELALDVVMNAPEYRDDVVDKVADYRSIQIAQSMERAIKAKVPHPTEENNEFLRAFKQRTGKLPAFLTKKEEP